MAKPFSQAGGGRNPDLLVTTINQGWNKPGTPEGVIYPKLCYVANGGGSIEEFPMSAAAVSEKEVADDAERDPEEPAGEAEQRRLDEELPADEPRLGPEGLAQADLADPLRDRHQHDVHHPDAADQQRDDGDPAQHDGEGAVDRARRGEDRLLGGDGEVHVVVGRANDETLAFGASGPSGPPRPIR